MCWKSKNKPILKIADKDIPVKKLLDEHRLGLFSPFMSQFKWNLGEERESEMEEPDYSLSSDDWRIRLGLHSLEEAREAKLDTTYYGIAYGYYCKGNYIAFSADTLFPYDAIIPKGANYYVNEYGEFVSDRLKIIGKAELN